MNRSLPQISASVIRTSSLASSSLLALKALLQPSGRTWLYKYAVYLLLLVNIRSFPLAWHVRIFRPVFHIRLRYYLLLVRVRLSFKPASLRKLEIDRWLESLPIIGANPFDTVSKYKTFASIDDCDFYGHLSNSSYAKTMDAVRFKAAIAWYPSFFRAGGWIALGATSYHFIREIPRLSRYEVRLSVVAWDKKWVFVVARFVTWQKPKKSKGIDTAVTSSPSPFQASIHTSDVPLESPPVTQTLTPAPGASSPLDVMKAIAAAQATQTEPDGTTLHCISVGQLCFKHGRITIPPDVVFTSEGWCKPSSSSSAPYSATNPPPHWAQVQAIRSIEHGGNLQAFKEFLRGGWRAFPEGRRFWEDALGGPIEEKRKANLEAISSFRSSLETARALY